MPSPKPKKTQKPRQPKRKTTKVPQPSKSTDIAIDKADHKERVIVWRQDTIRDTSAHTRRVKKLEKKHSVGNKMHKAFPLPGESSHWQYKFSLHVKVIPTARRLKMPLPEVCTIIEEMLKKLPVKDRWQLH
nr:hypothetical protein [Tanacetum cinerariifolium]